MPHVSNPWTSMTHRFVLVSTSPRTGEVVYQRCKKSTNSIGEIKDMNENGWKYWFLIRNPRFLSSFCLQTAGNLDLFEPYLHHSRPLIGPLDIINNARGPNRLRLFWDVKPSTAAIRLNEFSSWNRLDIWLEVCQFTLGRWRNRIVGVSL